MNTDEHRWVGTANQLSEVIIGCAYTVANELGHGYLEKVYENAMALELRSRDLQVEQQTPLRVHYKGHVVGDFIADLLVNTSIVIELKSIERVADIHIAQCINYLRAARLRLCLLINFGNPKVMVKRIVL